MDMMKQLTLFLGLSFVACITLAAAPQQGELSYLVRQARPGNNRNSEGTIFNLGHHRLLLAWTEFYSSDGQDWGPAQISTMESRDDGRSWSQKRVLQPNIGKMNVMEANLLRLHNGDIFFVFLRKQSPADCIPMFRISTDNGKSFSSPKTVPVNPAPSYNTINNDRVIQLRSGRILVPLAYTKDYRQNHHFVSRVYYTDNEGKTWRASKAIIDVKQSSVGAEEPGVVQLSNGKVMLCVRTKTGHPWQSFSDDGGVTWSTPKPMTVVAPNSPQSIKRIPSTGDLLMIWNNSATDRFPLSAAISKDNGHTWKDIRNLDDDASHTYAYTSITFVGKQVFFTYYAGPPDGKSTGTNFWSLKLKRVPIKWFYEKQAH
jgi:sialidase-1